MLGFVWFCSGMWGQLLWRWPGCGVVAVPGAGGTRWLPAGRPLPGDGDGRRAGSCCDRGAKEAGAGSAPTAQGHSCPRGVRLSCPWARRRATLVSLQGAALKFLPSVLGDVFGILDSSVLG